MDELLQQIASSFDSFELLLLQQLDISFKFAGSACDLLQQLASSSSSDSFELLLLQQLAIS